MTGVVVFSFMLAMASPAQTDVAASAAPSPAPLPVTSQSASLEDPSPTATSTPTVWLGLAVGQMSLAVRSEFGKPREILTTSAGDLWRYPTDGGKVTLELLMDQDVLVNIAARVNVGKRSTLADPFGGALGMTPAALTAARGAPIATYDDGTRVAYGEPDGVRWFYSFDGGVVTAIEESQPLPSTPPPIQVIADPTHDGTSIARALVVEARSDLDATNAEYAYIRSLECGAGGVWQVTGQALLTSGDRTYDQLHAACSVSKLVRDFYFDITSSLNTQ